MKGFVVPLFAVVLAVATLLAGSAGTPPLAQARVATGTIKGRIHLNGKLPGNTVIRMGKDPKCAEMNAGKQVVQEVVKATIDGSLANVFVRLEGSFPSAPAAKLPATIEQRGCVFVPRVLGVRAGQTLQIRNDDNLLHNLHSTSNHDNQFENVSQSKAGIVNSFKMKNEEIMFHLGCDVHSWMIAYIGVVTNPY